ncbi:MAG TPA: AraC family transcriptional regulator [Lachnospiraceae bacterium]|nr:AraC family transcriptional regulator [Lachnospiraceae bacterium]
MKNQLMDILNVQEKEELRIYQSEEQLLEMIREDFTNGEAILQLLKTSHAEAVRFMGKGTLNGFVGGAAIPVRKCDSFGIKKHTVCQVPYFHDHSFYEMIYVLRGTCVQSFIGNPDTLTLYESQLCLLCPGTIHSIARCGTDDMILKITIPKKLFMDAVAPVLKEDEDENPDCCFWPDVMVFKHVSARIDFYVTMLLEEILQKDRHSGSAIQNYISLLFIELKRGTKPKASEILNRLHQYFKTDTLQPSLHGFAQTMGYSDAYTGRLLKEKTGKSFLELALKMKLEKAEKLLTETTLSVEEIAEKLSYANASGLYKQFYKCYGMTPNAYRKK